eukprot:scaffold150972_cov18-Tisochrysis_lutea.AAC.1
MSVVAEEGAASGLPSQQQQQQQRQQSSPQPGSQQQQQQQSRFPVQAQQTPSSHYMQAEVSAGFNSLGLAGIMSSAPDAAAALSLLAQEGPAVSGVAPAPLPRTFGCVMPSLAKQGSHNAEVRLEQGCVPLEVTGPAPLSAEGTTGASVLRTGAS